MLCLHQAGCEDEFTNGIFRGHLFADSSLRQPARLHIDMEINEGILALAEGHVGSITALQKIMDVATQIDPHSAVVNGIAIEPLMWADTLKLYGDKTHRLMERLCHGDPERAATVIKGYTRGLYTVEQLHDALKDDGEPIDVDAICNRVADLIPGYVRLGGGRGADLHGDHLDNHPRPR